MMSNLSLLLIALACVISATGQDIAELERRNGFKGLKLGIPLDSVQGEKKTQERL